MNTAVLRKTLADYRMLWLGATLLLFGFVLLFVFATHSFPMEQGREWMNVPWVRKLIQAMVGADMADGFNPTGITSFAFSHPFMWVVVTTFILTTTSGVLVGEIDRGTMDLLASLPVSRPALYASVSAAILAMGLPLCWTIWLAAALGRRAVDDPSIAIDRLRAVTWHLYITYVYITCFAIAVSACCRRRGSAVAIVFAAVFASFVLNFICAMWPAAAELVDWASFLKYYTPLPVSRTGQMQWNNVMVLLCGAAAWWVFGLIAFRRRDIHAT